MALASMSYASNAYAGCPEILYHADYIGEAITLDATAFTNGVCKAGTPVNTSGVVANTSAAYGIVLTDVYAERPIATVVVEGYIKTAVAQAHSGVTVSADAKGALTKITFR